MCQVIWENGIACVCSSTKASNCSDCVTIGLDPTRYVVLEDREERLHIHRRTPIHTLDRDKFRYAITYGYRVEGEYRQREPEYVAHFYKNLTGVDEWSLVHGNLRACQWLVLMPFDDGSILWVTPGMAFRQRFWARETVLRAFMDAKLNADRATELGKTVENLWSIVQTLMQAIGTTLSRGNHVRLKRDVVDALIGFSDLFDLRVIKPAEERKRLSGAGHATFLDWIEAMTSDDSVWGRIRKAARRIGLVDREGRPKLQE